MPTLIKNGKNYSGTSVSLTQAEYDALTETQKNDGTVYFITDSNAVLDASDVAVGSGTVEDSIGSIAVIETSPATSSHAVGTYLVYNGKLYKVMSAISVGETLTIGSNISGTNVGYEFVKMANTMQTNFRFVYGQSGNANTMFDNGIYRCTNGSITNCPESDGQLIVLGQPEINCRIQFYVTAGGVVYVRIAWPAGSTSFTSSWSKLQAA